MAAMRAISGCKRRGSLFLDRRLIHAGGIVVADFLFDSASCFPGASGLFEKVAQDVEIVLVQCIETAPSRLSGGMGLFFIQLPQEY